MKLRWVYRGKGYWTADTSLSSYFIRPFSHGYHNDLTPVTYELAYCYRNETPKFVGYYQTLIDAKEVAQRHVNQRQARQENPISTIALLYIGIGVTAAVGITAYTLSKKSTSTTSTAKTTANSHILTNTTIAPVSSSTLIAPTLPGPVDSVTGLVLFNTYNDANILAYTGTTPNSTVQVMVMPVSGVQTALLVSGYTPPTSSVATWTGTTYGGDPVTFLASDVQAIARLST
jgi:Tfp pilus assembly protein PilV